MSADRLRCVCFDWGGVLLGHHRDWAEGCAAAGFHDEPEHFDERDHAERERLTALFQVGAIGQGAYLEGLAETMRGRRSVDDMRRLVDAWITREYDGASELIDDLHAIDGLTTALLSNTNEMHWASHLPGADGSPPRFPTAGRLHLRFGSHLWGLAKPERAIFERFERETGFGGAEILFFDDRAENVLAARELGWVAEVVDHARDPVADMRRVLARVGVLPSTR